MPENGRPLLACITGTDGAGKDTLIEHLASRMGAEGRAVAVASIWDQLTSPVLEGHWMFSDREAAACYIASLTSTARMYFFAHSLAQSVARALSSETDVVMVNGYWYKYYATEVVHGGDAPALRALASALPRPDVVFHLRIDPAVAARRKDSFTAYETGYADRDDSAAFEAFQERAAAELDKLAGELGWISLAAHRSEHDLTDEILERLRERLAFGVL